MDILLKKFSLRRNGVRYFAGDVVKGLPEEEAVKLAEESNGEIVLMQYKQSAEEETAGKDAEKNEETAAEVTDDAAEAEGLPELNPTESVKGTKKK